MSSFFEEIANLDRPMVSVNVNIGGKPLRLQAKRPNSLEADAIEAYYSEEYAKLIVRKTESQNGELSELDQMRNIVQTRTRDEIIEQLLQTRENDIQRVTMEKAAFDPSAELAMASTFKDNAERDSYVAKRRQELVEAKSAARAEIRAEYEVKADDELNEIMAQVNINIKALAEALAARHAMYIYLTLHDDKGERVCPSPQAVREQFQAQTMKKLVQDIDAGFILGVSADLPFVSQDVDAPSGQPTSANSSEQAATPSSPGGKPTKATRKNSKRSSTPPDGTPRKKA